MYDTAGGHVQVRLDTLRRRRYIRARRTSRSGTRVSSTAKRFGGARLRRDIGHVVWTDRGYGKLAAVRALSAAGLGSATLMATSAPVPRTPLRAGTPVGASLTEGESARYTFTNPAPAFGMDAAAVSFVLTPAGDGADVGDGAVADALLAVARPDAGASISGNDRMGGGDA